MTPKELDEALWRQVFISALSGTARGSQSDINDLDDIVLDAQSIADLAVQAYHPDGCACAVCNSPVGRGSKLERKDLD